MTNKQAQELGIDSRTYDPKKDVMEEIMKIVKRHIFSAQFNLIVKVLQAYIEKL